MANDITILLDPNAQSGLEVIAKIYDSAGDQQGADISLIEAGSTGYYSGDITSLIAGSYTVGFYSSTSLIGVGELDWDGTSNITLSTVNTAASQSTIQRVIAGKLTASISQKELTGSISQKKLTGTITKVNRP